MIHNMLMAQDIDNFIRNCKICKKFARKNIKELLKPCDISWRPWERIATNIFSYANSVYLVVYDSYSNWLEVLTMKNISSNEVMFKLKSNFAKFGCPDIMVCGNIPFNSLTNNLWKIQPDVQFCVATSVHIR